MAAPVQPIERKLVAIFAADVAGYSRLMGQDEVGTLRRLAAHREIMDRLIAQHRGRIANTAGDSVLAEFPSAVDAVQCAVQVQQGLAEANEGVPEDRRMEFRIGLHVGDVMVRGADLLGDGVNVAARLQALAEPGGVCVSAEAYKYAQKLFPNSFWDLGEQRIRNIQESVRAYALKAPRAVSLEAQASRVAGERASIAVLPFNNLSGDVEQDYFADGVVEDFITALTRFKWLTVIARNSSFTYKGRAVDVKQVGRELSVRYVLEGSIRKAGTRLRMTGQLIEAASGRHIWAERYDRDLTDVFDLQDELTRSVVAAIEPNLRSAEIQRARTKPTDSLDAYDLYLRALQERYPSDASGLRDAENLLLQATTIDPNFSDAWASLAECISRQFTIGASRDVDDVTKRACEAASRAVNADADNGIAFAAAAWCFTILGGRHSEALEYIDRAVRLNPNSFYVHARCGWALVHCGEFEPAIASFESAFRLSPIDPERFIAYTGNCAALFFMQRHEEAAASATRASQLQPSHPVVLRWLAACLAMSGRIAEASEAADALRKAGFSLTFIREINGRQLRYPWMLDLFTEGLVRAGLTE